MEEWRRYFANPIDVPPVTLTARVPPAEADFPFKIGDSTRTEVEAAIQSLKNSKAPGIDSAMCAETI